MCSSTHPESTLHLTLPENRLKFRLRVPEHPRPYNSFFFSIKVSAQSEITRSFSKFYYTEGIQYYIICYHAAKSTGPSIPYVIRRLVFKTLVL